MGGYMNNIVIAIGGTGAKIGESFVYLMAAGFMKEPCTIFVVDKDMNCRNTTREIQTISSYQNVHKVSGEGGTDDVFAKAGLEMIRLDFNELIKDLLKMLNIEEINSKEADSLIGITRPKKRSSNEEALNLLYPKEFQEKGLEEGFYGRPYLGAAVFQAVETTSSYKENELYQKIQNSLNNGEVVRIFLVGSIFGGTGATLFPNIAKSIRRIFLDKQKQIQISGALMLPYFALPRENDEKNTTVNQDDFNKKAAIALGDYSKRGVLKTNSNDTNYIFDSLYFMGSPSLGKTSKEYVLGGEKQEHNLFIIDLYASLAICDFFNNFDKNVNEEQIIIPVVSDPRTITWDDLPNSADTKKKLLSLTRFSTFILTYLNPLLHQDPEKIRLHKLIMHLYGSEGKVGGLFGNRSKISDEQLSKLQQSIEVVGNFCKNYLIEYVLQIQSSRANSNNNSLCNLFNEDGIKEIDSKISSGFERSQKCPLNCAIPTQLIDNRKYPSNGGQVVEKLIKNMQKNYIKKVEEVNDTLIQNLLREIYKICEI